MVGTTFVFILFFIYQRSWKKLQLKHYLIALFILIFCYIPVIVSDIKNEGGNYKRLMASVSQQKSEDTFRKNISETVEKTARFYFYFPFPVTEEEFKNIELVRFIYLGASLVLIFLVFLKKTKFLSSIGSKKKRVLAFLILLYFGIFFLIDFGIADRLEKPRYWISIAPIAFFVLAFWLELIIKTKKSFWLTGLLILVVSFSFFENVYSIYWYYSSLKEGAKRELPFKDPIIRPHRELITFGQIERASDYMSKKAIKENKNICYLSTDYQTKNSFKYVISYKYENLLVKRLDDLNESSKDCVMFVIAKSDKSIDGVKEDLADRFDYKKIYRDGAITLWQLKVRRGQDKSKQGDEIFKDTAKLETRTLLWKDVFEK